MEKLEDMDIVYVVKDAAYNDELKYSLRSVEKNFPHKRVIFYGGKVVGIHPDKQVVVKQEGKRKWDRVRNMLRMIAENDEITEDFVLFNDDFFVMRPVDTLPYFSDEDLSNLCTRIEIKNGYLPTPYTTELKHTIVALKENNLPVYNYELHRPIIFNRKRLLDVIEKFSNARGTRSLYANMLITEESDYSAQFWFPDDEDVKIFKLDVLPPEDADYVSTEDRAFNEGLAGKFLRDKFPDKSKWEK